MKSQKLVVISSSIALCLGLVSCQAPPPKNDFVWSSPTDKLSTVRPVDIAVMMPKDLTKRPSILPGISPAALPLKEIRKIAYNGLIQRRYTPLSMEFIDRAFLGKAVPSEASWSEVNERCSPDAILRMQITRWDSSLLQSSKVFSIGAEVFLEDAKSGEIIWQAKADRDVWMDDQFDVERATKEELQERAIQRFFEKLFNQLPVREAPAKE